MESCFFFIISYRLAAINKWTDKRNKSSRGENNTDNVEANRGKIESSADAYETDEESENESQ